MKLQVVGCDGLREWLVSQGFQLTLNPLRHDDDGCNWYAYRWSQIEARECECNDGKPMQVIVAPHRYEGDGHAFENVEVEVIGEAGGVWFKLAAYSLKPDEVQAKLPDVERGLIAAWNALR